MKKKDIQDRIQFLNNIQNGITRILAQNSLDAGKLASVVLEDYYDLTNPLDIGDLLFEVELMIDEQIKPIITGATESSIRELTNLGVNHAVTTASPVVGSEAFGMLNIADQLAIEYINRITPGGTRLSDSIWGSKDKQAIYSEVFKAIQQGDDTYTLAKNIEKQVKEGIPYSNIKRIAETELSYAYSHSKVDSAVRQAEEIPGLESYIEIKLSPAHPKEDICDAMAGVYKAKEAPLPPYHPHCFTGDTLVYGGNVSTKTVSEYDGPTITITTAKGSRFTTTPNHPMLSTLGFVSANSLKKGDYLIATGDRFESLISIKPNSKSVKSLIKDIIVPDGVVFSAMPSSVDFHGDGAFHKKVDIILSQSKLLGNLKTPLTEFFNKFSFINRLIRLVKLYTFGSIYKLLLSLLLSSNSIMSLLSTSSSKRRIKFIDRFLSFTLRSYLHIISEQEIPNPRSANFKFLTKRKFRDSSIIFADKIVDIHISHFKGNVYNLETKDHWYSANSIIAHNCLCITREFIAPSKRKISTTTIGEQFNSFLDKDILGSGTIETYDKDYEIPQKKGE